VFSRCSDVRLFPAGVRHDSLRIEGVVDTPNAIPTPANRETDMFRYRLDNMIDMRHELMRLPGLISWERFDEPSATRMPRKGARVCRRG
jgi:hypothetical protein